MLEMTPRRVPGYRQKVDPADDHSLRHVPYLTEEIVPVGLIVGFVVGLVVCAIGLERWRRGDLRPVDTWILATLLTGVFFKARDALRRLVVARRWERLYPVLWNDPDEIGKTGEYTTPPERDSPPYTTARRIAHAIDRVLGPPLRLVAPLLPLLAVILDLSAINLVLIGMSWSVFNGRELMKRRRARRPHGTRELAP